MASKSAQGQTKKYGGVVKSVKDTQTQEPRITPDQVIAAFKSFGFEPNQRNHNDIAYWTTRGQSEITKLVEDLHNKRVDINNQEDAQKKSESDRNRSQEEMAHKQNQAKQDLTHQQTLGKTAMPRLSDQDLTALFDEYGLPAPDPEWARNHLPNDPKKIRSILEMQRKTADDMLKQHAKNAVNSIPAVPKSGSTPAMQMTGVPMMGMGGPNPMGMQGGMIQDSTPTTPFFIGDHALVRITNPTNPNVSTVWLVDSKKKVLRPFLSEQAFQSAFEDPTAAEKSIVTISTKELGTGGALDGFKPLQGNQGVNEDGSMDKIEFSPSEIQKRYGKQSDPASENKALTLLDGVLGKMNTPVQAQGLPTQQ